MPHAAHETLGVAQAFAGFFTAVRAVYGHTPVDQAVVRRSVAFMAQIVRRCAVGIVVPDRDGVTTGWTVVDTWHEFEIETTAFFGGW